MALKQSYYILWFESFRLKNTSGHKSEIQLKLVSGQSLPGEVQDECGSRSVDPFGLVTECSTTLFEYPVGTQFSLRAKLTDRKGKGLFFYNYHGWKPIEVVKPS